ncbi:MAG: ABC transporter permease [Acidobacteria bacterium]|nr:ABC transporter permease [Acidobacteriota bacterium]
MFLRLVYESFWRQKRRKALAGVAIMLGVAVATAMIAVATDIGDKMNRELRSFGANLVITPEQDTLDIEIAGVNLKPPSDGAFLNEDDLVRIRGTFWHNNIVGFAPMLPVMVDLAGTKITLLGTYFAKHLHFGQEDFVTGVRTTHPWWQVEGSWPGDESGDVLLGERLAARMALEKGAEVDLGGEVHRVIGILSSGAAEDDEVVAPLHVAQQILRKPEAVRRVYVSALTKPEDGLARRDPKMMSPKLFDRWYCSPYVQSIAYQLHEAIPHSHVDEIRQVAQNEGTVLSRIKGLMLLVTLAALLSSALAVSAAMATTISERRSEVGLMKALGAGHGSVAAIFFAEAALLAFFGGLAGYAAGLLLAHQIGRAIFGSNISIQPVLFPIILSLAIAVTFAGSAAAIRKAVLFDPVFALRGDA